MRWNGSQRVLTAITCTRVTTSRVGAVIAVVGLSRMERNERKGEVCVRLFGVLNEVDDQVASVEKEGAAVIFYPLLHRVLRGPLVSLHCRWIC